jgi:flagellar export protein FliJ
LKLRENDRQTERVTLAEQRREEDAVLRKLESLGDEKSKAINDFRNSGNETLSRQEIWFQRQTIEVIDKHIDKSKAHFNDVRHRIVETEERLIERHKDVRMMEGYVDRLKTDAVKVVLDAEQLELDDIAVMRHARFSSKTFSSASSQGK